VSKRISEIYRQTLGAWGAPPVRRFQVLDLFSGIGGFSLGLESTGLFETVAFCEKEAFPRKVLGKHWPHLPIHEDIHEVSGHAYQGIDLITGGFPCQPVSVAGARKGKEDERWLWPEMFRVIREARPRWCLIENVPGLRTKHADDVLADMEGQGYTCWPLVVGAVHAGAPHRRQRVWIVAYAESIGRTTEGQRRRQEQSRAGSTGEARDVDDAPRKLSHRSGREERGWLELADSHRQWAWANAPEPVLRGVDARLPCGMDRRDRLKALGNAVVPQVVAALGRVIRGLDLLDLR